VVNELRELVYESVAMYLQASPDCRYLFGESNAMEQCAYMHQLIRGRVQINITGSWINVSPPGYDHSAQLAHHHLNKKATVALVYYVNTGDDPLPIPPPRAAGEDGVSGGAAAVPATTRENSPAHAGTYFFSEAHGEPILQRPSASGVLVFPGWLSHRMDQHWGEGFRITVAVNMAVEFHPANGNEGASGGSPPLRFETATKNLFPDENLGLRPHFPGEGRRRHEEL